MVRKELTSEIILKGKIVKYADCTRVIENEVTVVADLLDEEETVLETNAVFLYEGEHKDSPFTLTQEEIDEIKS